MEWEHCNRFKGKFYWILQMKYEDIKRIEYDEEQHLLRVYGPYSGKKWDSIKKNRCYDSFDALQMQSLMSTLFFVITMRTLNN